MLSDVIKEFQSSLTEDYTVDLNKIYFPVVVFLNKNVRTSVLREYFLVVSCFTPSSVVLAFLLQSPLGRMIKKLSFLSGKIFFKF